MRGKVIQMFKKIEAFLEERTRDNWGAPWHWFICHWSMFGLVWLTHMLNLGVGGQWAFWSVVTFWVYFIIVTYEKNQNKKGQTKRGMWEDILCNHGGLFTGITSGLGVFY